MTSKDTTVALPATATKGWERGAGWTVTVPNAPVYGHGASLPAARADASAQVATLIANVTELPAFVRDGDGSLWVFTSHADGHRAIRIRSDDTVSGCSSVGAGTPAEAADSIARCHAGSVRLS
jgi:hypothetical protein